jgi:DNA-binding NarL/FixJ family response regulator
MPRSRTSIRSQFAIPAAGPAPATDKARRFPGSTMLSELAWKEIARSLKLSGRELQLVRGVFDDCTELAIASNLGIARRTVCTHCERLYRKLAVTGRVKLVLRVMEEFHALTVSPENILPPICRNWDAPRCPLRRK